MSESPWKLHPSNEQLLPKLEHWYQTEPGKTIMAEERQLIDQALTHCFGYHLLQLSVCRDISLHEASGVQSRFSCHPLGDKDDTVSEFDQLPIATDSLDTAILHHAHEFVASPHQVLREMQRVLVPHGHLIIVGFNPWSLLGLFSLLARRSRHSMWHNHMLSTRRMLDWLSLLGFQIQNVHYAFHRPPIKRHELFRHLVPDALTGLARNWPFGSCYVISAVKEQAGMTPIKTRWQIPAKRFSGLSPVKPTASSGRNLH